MRNPWLGREAALQLKRIRQQPGPARMVGAAFDAPTLVRGEVDGIVVVDRILARGFLWITILLSVGLLLMLIVPQIGIVLLLVACSIFFLTFYAHGIDTQRPVGDMRLLMLGALGSLGIAVAAAVAAVDILVFRR